MNYEITLISEDGNQAVDNLIVFLPAIPRKGELINVQIQDGDHYNLEVTQVTYEVMKAGVKPMFGQYQCVDISIFVEEKKPVDY